MYTPGASSLNPRRTSEALTATAVMRGKPERMFQASEVSAIRLRMGSVMILVRRILMRRQILGMRPMPGVAMAEWINPARALSRFARPSLRSRPKVTVAIAMWITNLYRRFFCHTRTVRYFSTFSGIGGFELGISSAHNLISVRNAAKAQEHRWYSSNNANAPSVPVCLGYSEIDRHAVTIYQKHFPSHTNYGDITKLNPATLPDFDLLVGGFPCQAFSVAGKRRGFQDARGTLFFDLARILQAKQPRLFCFENVKGLLSHDDGDTFRTIITTLIELGYDLQWQVLNSKNFGVPQNRERVFIIGHLRGTPRPEVFPFTNTDTTTDKRHKSIDPEVASTLRSRYGNGTGSHVVLIPEATKRGYVEAHVGQSINLAVPNSTTRRGRVSDIANTLDTNMQQHTLTIDMRIRRLTPTECERLQGFPDGWTQGLSDSQRYKCCGNAVTVNVITDIMMKLLY